MDTFILLRNAYIELLMIDDIKTRISLNNTYCLLRDSISEIIDESSQDVQEHYEEVALKKKIALHENNTPLP